jgi:hypothetical protein
MGRFPAHVDFSKVRLHIACRFRRYYYGAVDGSRTGVMTTMAILKRECFSVALCRTTKVEPEGV